MFYKKKGGGDPKRKSELLKTRLYLLTLENCPNHDKKKIEQSGCLFFLSNHCYIMLVFMINCKMMLLYMNYS